MENHIQLTPIVLNVKPGFWDNYVVPTFNFIVNFDYIGVVHTVINLIPLLKVVSASTSAVLLLLFIYMFRSFMKYEHEYAHKFEPHEEAAPHGVKIEEKNVATEKWDKITTLVSSANSSDWRLAILEADIILDDMLTAMEYKGESMGDKLKQVEKSDFLTIDDAWEAHKIRNQIAHEGADFNLNQREARRVIELYKNVFKEFHYI